MIYRFTWWCCLAVFRILWPASMSGRDSVPRAGPVIIATNHCSNIDPPLIAICFWRPVWFLAKEELFRRGLFGWWIRRTNAYPVRRGAVDRAAIRRTLDLLAQGQAVVIFPEGTRGDSDEPGDPEMGVGLIAAKSGAPVVPAYIWGTHRALDRTGRVTRRRVGIRFGAPMTFAERGVTVHRSQYQQFAEEVMSAIRDLREAHLASTPDDRDG